MLSTMRASLLAVLLAPAVSAQLSGSYTIDPNGSGSRNYKTFAAATAALKASGVSGPVLFNVTTGTITESWTVPAVASASATNTITFKGLAVPPNLWLTKLAGGTTSIITLEAGAHHIVFDGFDFTTAASGHAITGLATGSGSSTRPISNIEIANCRFGRGINGNRGRGHIYVEGRGRSRDWNIHHCTFDMKNYTYGLYMSQVAGCRVWHNEFKLEGTANALYWINWNNSRNVMANNLFTGTTSTSVNACAINVAASNINNDVCFNTFNISTSGSAIRTFGTRTNYNRIYGNVIAVKGRGVGIHMTIRTLNYWLSDGNLYFIQSGNIGKIVSATYKGLAAWRTATQSMPLGRQDVNSVEGDPKFKSATDLRLTKDSPGLGKAIIYSGRHDPVTDWDGWIRGSKRDTGAFELTAYKLYGKGCAGTGGKVPKLSIAGNIAPGDKVSLDVSNARPNTTAVLAIGPKKANVPLGGGCTLLNSPVLLFYLRTNATGTTGLSSTIPASVQIIGFSAYAQWGLADPATAYNVAATEGAEIRI